MSGSVASKPAWAVSVAGVDTPTSGSVGRVFGSSGLVPACAGVVISVPRLIGLPIEPRVQMDYVVCAD